VNKREPFWDVLFIMVWQFYCLREQGFFYMNAKILIVDDSATARETLGALLYSPDYDLYFASNGLEALEKAGQVIPDLILLDVMMPDMNGYEVCENLRQDVMLAEVPIIMVTALDDRKSRLQGIRAGADDFISKPFDTAELGARVQMIVRLNRYRRLHAERRRFEQIIQFSPDGIVIVDQDGMIQLTNQTFLNFLRAAPESEVVGQPLAKFLGGDSPAIFSKVVQKVVSGDGQSMQMEAVLDALGETSLAVELAMGRFEWGDRRMVQVVIHDLTQRHQAEAAKRESEQRYRKMMQMANDAIFVSDVDTFQLVDVNEKAQSLVGMEREALLSMKIFDLYPAEIQEKCKAFYAKSAKERSDSAEVCQIVDSTGSRIDVEITNSSIELGSKTLLMGIFRDITERRKQERVREALLTISVELRKAETYAEALSVMLEQLRVILNADKSVVARRAGKFVELYSSDEDEMQLHEAVWKPGNGKTHWTEWQPFSLYNTPGERPQLPWLDNIPPAVALLEAPLFTHDKVIGSLWVSRRSAWEDTDGQILASIADLAANAIQRMDFLNELERRLAYLQTLFTLDRAIAGRLELDVIFEVLLQLVQDQLHVSAADVLFYDEAEQSLTFVSGTGFRVHTCNQKYPWKNLKFSGQVVATHQPVKILDMRAEIGKLTDSLSPEILLDQEDFKTFYGIPLKAKGQLLGVLEIFHRERVEYDDTAMDFLLALADQTAIAISQAKLFDEMQKANRALTVAYDETIEGWALALEMRDNETQGHSWRVTELVVELGRQMGVSGADLDRLRRGAILHDIGKMGVPDSILHKPGKLTPDEWEIMKKHPVYGYQMLSNIDFLRDSLDIPLYHHERWDGTGYPEGLKGEEIPLPARIFAIIDVWDAVTNDRPYHAAWSHEEALAHVYEQDGKHFDPQVVKSFLAILNLGETAGK